MSVWGQRMTVTKAKNVIDNQIKVLIYGKSGVGKTRFATSSDNSIVVDFERGLGSALNKDIDVLECKNASDFTEALEYLDKDESHDTVIVDSFTEYGRNNFCPTIW